MDAIFFGAVDAIFLDMVLMDGHIWCLSKNIVSI